MMVHRLLRRGGLMGRERWHDELLGADEWWLADLAKRLNVSHRKLRDWVICGWVRGRQTPSSATGSSGRTTTKSLGFAA